MSYLVIYKKDKDINYLLTNGNKIFLYQPYVFALKTNKEENITELFEAQFYTKTLTLLSSWNRTSEIITEINENALERRGSHLSGAKIRLKYPPVTWSKVSEELLILFKNRFNFTINNVSLIYGEEMKALADDKIDICMKQPTQGFSKIS